MWCHSEIEIHDMHTLPPDVSAPDVDEGHGEPLLHSVTNVQQQPYLRDVSQNADGYMN